VIDYIANLIVIDDDFRD